MDSYGNGVMRMRHTIENILKRGNYIRMMDGRYTDGFVDPDVLQTIISEGGAELFDNQGVQMARRPTLRAPDVLQAHDMGEVNGVKLTYVKGNVFATPAKRR